MTLLRQEATKQGGVASLSAIKRAVCAGFGVSLAELVSPRRPTRLVIPRQAVFWLARQAGYTYTAIARAFGDRDHTTIMHGVSRTGRRMAEDAAIADLVRSLATELEGMWGP